MQQKLEQSWADLEQADSPAGVLHRLLDTEWVGELSAAMLKPDNHPALLLELSESVAIDTETLAKSDAVDLTTTGDAAGVTAIQITLADQKYRDTFTALCADLADKVLATTTQEDGARSLILQLGRWLRFLKRRRLDILTRERQLGLYGELTVLQDLLAGTIGHASAATAWSGPHGAYQDFQLGDLAIEVKTLSATQPQQLHIETERQLDDRGLDALILTHLSIDAKHGSGRALPEVVEQVREGLREVGTGLEDFDDRLFETGYLDIHAHLYAQTGYTERALHHYRVQPGFPRIVEDDLRPGLGAVRYIIDASACSPFEVSDDDLRSWLTGAQLPTDSLAEEESLHHEYKATAWKAADPQVPDKVINEGIVKAVAAFLNSEGGTLVIGAQDRTREVTGVEVDLDHLGEDLDGYENRLTQLLLSALGEANTKRTRATFEERDSRTICLLAVGASPRPVFADSPARKDKRNVFWVRVNNTTRELSGPELVDYIRDHWG